jgi:hypothetical protein
MPRGRPRLHPTDDQTIKILQGEIADLDIWDRLNKSEYGKFLIRILDNSINQTLDEEDKKDIYSMDSNAREYFFSAVRSKRQTLKAIRDKLLNAESEKGWRIVELQKILPKE